MGEAMGFEYRERKNGTVVISHHGREVTLLRGARARKFLTEVDEDPQNVMARWTGNYKRGNERSLKRPA